MKKLVLSLMSICMLFVLSASEVANNSRYPEFSWDRLPVCLHLSRMATADDPVEDFTDEELAIIAKHPVICIEKTQGVHKYGSLKEGTIAAAKAIKAVNPNVKVLFYRNSGKDFDGIIKREHPDWTLWSQEDLAQGKEIDRMGRYDPSNAECMDWWCSTLVDAVDNEWVDGAFIDALIPYFSEEENKKKMYGESRYVDISQGLLKSLSRVYDEFKSKDKMLIGNTLRGSAILDEGGSFLHNHMDGGMIEHFIFRQGTSPEDIEKDMVLIRRAASDGKICVVKAWPRLTFVQGGEIKAMSDQEVDQMLREDITFPLACFLASMGEYSYFCYSWGYREDNGGLVDYPEYNKPLGKPITDARKSGWVYTREFEHASVWVDLENQEAKITWK